MSALPQIYNDSKVGDFSRSGSTPILFFQNVRSGERFFDFFTSNNRCPYADLVGYLFISRIQPVCDGLTATASAQHSNV